MGCVCLSTSETKISDLCLKIFIALSLNFAVILLWLLCDYTIIKIVYPPKEPVSLPYFNYLNVIRVFN